MGFFSAIKKMFGSAEQADTTAPQDDATAASVAAQAGAETGAESVAETAAPDMAQAAQPLVVSPADEALTLRLREAEPKLSVWLGIVLEGVDETGELLWQRLFFLLRALDAPEAEAQNFVREFQAWLIRMDYRQVEEFRSELQYRLALALDMEDEEDERNRLFLKISQGLSRTREQFAKGLDALFAGHGELNDAFWEELEELFIMADLGYEPSVELVERLKERARKEKVIESAKVRDLLMAEVEEIFRAPRRIAAVNSPEVVLMIGVNGVGKTTTIAKLAYLYKDLGKRVMLAAGDTFRAAASEQLETWADRAGVPLVKAGEGADPAAVIFDAVKSATARGYDMVIADTAGRLHNKKGLMDELAKISRSVKKASPDASLEVLLVLDAITGQNAISQAQEFCRAAGATGVVLTKLDGTPKGGCIIGVHEKLGLPIRFVGVGEKIDDLIFFSATDFAEALLPEVPQHKKEETEQAGEEQA